MSIDRIGKSGGVPAPEPHGVGEAPEAAEKPFTVDRAGGAEAVDKTSPLERLRAGEIDVNGYVDLKVDQATQHVAGLSPEDFDELKKILREQMVSDPEFVDLVRQATGKAPDPPPDE